MLEVFLKRGIYVVDEEELDRVGNQEKRAKTSRIIEEVCEETAAKEFFGVDMPENGQKIQQITVHKDHLDKEAYADDDSHYEPRVSKKVKLENQDRKQKMLDICDLKDMLNDLKDQENQIKIFIKSVNKTKKPKSLPRKTLNIYI